jgi:hypothetical protein
MGTMTIRIKRKEAKTLRFTCTTGGVAVNLSAATMSFMAKADKSALDAAAIISKVHADFGVTSAASGIVTLALSATNTDFNPGTYYAELKSYFSADNIDKSADIKLIIEQPVIAA